MRLGKRVLYCAVSVLVIAACAGDDDAGGKPNNARVIGPATGSGGSMFANAAGSSGTSVAGSGGGGVRAMPMTGGGSGMAGMQGMPIAGTGGTTMPTGSGGVSPGAGGSGGMMKPVIGPDQMLPPVSDYTAPGPFNPTIEVDNTGPDGMFTMYRPTNLDADGFKFVPATWGNGITTTPQIYPWLNTVASHGFVIIASNSTSVSTELMVQGLDWLIMQNDMPGELQGKLDTSRGVCIGYSLGGQASVGCGATHANIVATVAMHPAGGFPAGMTSPLLLFSGLMDDVCVPASFVQPVFDQSPVPTFYGLLPDATHYEPPVTGGRELGPLIAWLRLWVYGDQGAKPLFYGTDCTLCKAPWTMPQSKMLN